MNATNDNGKLCSTHTRTPGTHTCGCYYSEMWIPTLYHHKNTAGLQCRTVRILLQSTDMCLTAHLSHRCRCNVKDSKTGFHSSYEIYNKQETKLCGIINTDMAQLSASRAPEDSDPTCLAGRLPDLPPQHWGVIRERGGGQGCGIVDGLCVPGEVDEGGGISLLTLHHKPQRSGDCSYKHIGHTTMLLTSTLLPYKCRLYLLYHYKSISLSCIHSSQDC